MLCCSDELANARTHIKTVDDSFTSNSYNNYSTSSYYGGSSYYSRGHTAGRPAAPGVCGLNNLGAWLSLRTSLAAF